MGSRGYSNASLGYIQNGGRRREIGGGKILMMKVTNCSVCGVPDAI